MTDNEVDHATSGLGCELRAVLSAALALAQLHAQHRAQAAGQAAREAGAGEQEVAQRVAAERRLRAAQIPTPQALVRPGAAVQEVGRAWAEASEHRDVSPDLAQRWDEELRRVGVDPDLARAVAAQQDRGQERGAGRDTVGPGREWAAATAVITADRDADRASAASSEARDVPAGAEPDRAAVRAAQWEAVSVAVDTEAEGRAAHIERSAAHGDEVQGGVARHDGDQQGQALIDGWSDGAPAAQAAGREHPLGRDPQAASRPQQGKRSPAATRRKAKSRDSGLSR